MPRDTLADVKDFLRDVVSDLTGMHVKAAAFQNAPDDKDAVDALAQLPAGLIERAQELAGRIESEQNADSDDKPSAKKPAAAKSKARSR